MTRTGSRALRVLAGLRPFLAAALLAVAGAGAAHAQHASGGSPQVHVDATLRTDASGGVLTLTLVPRPGWHIYAHERGDLGRPTDVRWSGTIAADPPRLQWPPGSRFVDELGLEYFAYVDTTQVHAVIPAAALRAAGRDLHLTVSWVACGDVCLPQSAQLRLRLPRRPRA
jgi:DsbC/DsbD-like thiol-disulfide interchange protein